MFTRINNYLRKDPVVGVSVILAITGRHNRAKTVVGPILVFGVRPIMEKMGYEYIQPLPFEYPCNDKSCLTVASTSKVIVRIALLKKWLALNLRLSPLVDIFSRGISSHHHHASSLFF